MSLAEEIAGLPLATLLDCRQHYERAIRWEGGIRLLICQHTLALINRELTRRLPPAWPELVPAPASRNQSPVSAA